MNAPESRVRSAFILPLSQMRYEKKCCGVVAFARARTTLLQDQKILLLGAGEAGIGIGDLIVSALVDHGNARRRCWFVARHRPYVRAGGQFAGAADVRG
jgi:Malic enzyme, NAD binding domain